MKKLYRSSTDSVLAGVCGGLAEYFQIDSGLVRIIFIILLLATGVAPFGIAYVIAILMLPYKPQGPNVVSEQ